MRELLQRISGSAKSIGIFALVGSALIAFQNCGQLTSLGSSRSMTSSSSELAPLRQAELHLPQNLATLAQNQSQAAQLGSSQNPTEAICVIRGGAGLFLARVDFATQAACQATCTGFAASHPNRTCSWNNASFFGDPQQSCLVAGGAHVALTSTAQATFSECQSSCSAAAAQHPYRTCDWGTDRFYQPAAASECRVIGGAGKMLLNPSIFGALADCQAACASFQSNVYRQCYYGASLIQGPGPDQRCDIWGGAGKVLTPSFYGAIGDCQAACASYTSNPNRICFYGKTRVQ